MAVLTNAQFAALALGYLSGQDLMMYAPIQLLISRNTLLPTQPQIGCNFAYAEVKAHLRNRYAIDAELLKTPPTGNDADTRDEVCVKITAVKAVQNILAGAQNLSPHMEDLFKWADKTLLAIRNAQLNLNIPYPAPAATDPVTGIPGSYPGDQAELVCSSFKWIG